MPTDPAVWPTNPITAKIAWPIAAMDGAPWNLLDATGTRIAICGTDPLPSPSVPTQGVDIAAALVWMLDSLKTENDTLRREHKKAELDAQAGEAVIAMAVARLGRCDRGNFLQRIDRLREIERAASNPKIVRMFPKPFKDRLLAEAAEEVRGAYLSGEIESDYTDFKGGGQ